MTPGPISIPCPSPTDDPATANCLPAQAGNLQTANSPDSLLQSRADHILELIAGQLNNEQHQADTTFCQSVVITYDLDHLSLEFGVPVRHLLRACTRAMVAEKLPPTCSITSDHTLRCLLRPTRQGTVPERGLSPEPDSHA
jgi:hypothetical protein